MDSNAKAQTILCVHSGGPTLRGSELALLDLLVSIQKRGKKLLLLCDQQTLKDRALSLGIKTDLIPHGELMLDPRDFKLNIWGLIRSAMAVRAAIKKLRPDVVYANGGRALQMCYAAARLTSTPIAVHLHSQYNKRYLMLYGITRADLVINCSENVRKVHEQKAKFRRSVGLRNAVDETRFPSVENLHRPTASQIPTIGFIGSVDLRKGLDILIRAVHILNQRGVRCVLRVGGAEKDTQFRALANQLGQPVEFLGEVRRDQIANFFADAHIHALPSRMDAMPLSIIEAAYSGVPTIAHNVGGISEALMDGQLGILYEENTPENLAHILERALSMQWDAKQLAAKARSEFSLPLNAEKLCGMFDSLLPTPLPGTGSRSLQPR